MSVKNKVISVTSERIVFPGRALCRCSDGVAVFVDGLLPGERAEVFVVKDKKTFREGLLKDITLKSSERIDSLCPAFGSCGGCSFQNAAYEDQIKYKQKYVAELLSFIDIKVSDMLIGSQIWHYRNKMEFSFFDVSPCKFEKSGKSKVVVYLGLHRKKSFKKYVSVSNCFIADKDFLRVIDVVKRFANESDLLAYDNKRQSGFFRHLVLRKAQNNNQLLINIVTNDIGLTPVFWAPMIKELDTLAHSVYWTLNNKKSDTILSDKLILMHGKPFITEKLYVGGKDYFFNISPFSFFQTNSKGTEILYNEILRLLSPSKNDVLLDLYCGIGTIGILLAQSVKKVIGVEQVEQAVGNAKENASINNICNIDFYASTSEDWTKRNKNCFDIIIVDPPRSGLTKNVVDFLLESKAKKIVYVSCDPATLARDLQVIVEKKYSVKEITPIDMFPQTYHVEVIVLLELVEK
ncbi:MAG: 23S rRNA (uracil(1939)-C(5))-methyltransferase RlmD [Endomicrobium sp.]|jgi:23S rRNA (uracil-5-)-methyltransferase RumA|nr:23S rRNA (uracil(1939)-C(5))-methyltransferase RlmD [Endomicrobium sp.]